MIRFKTQRELEDEIVAFKPDADEARDLLHAVIAALKHEYGEPSQDVLHYCTRLEEAIEKFAEKAAPYEPDPIRDEEEQLT